MSKPVGKSHPNYWYEGNEIETILGGINKTSSEVARKNILAFGVSVGNKDQEEAALTKAVIESAATASIESALQQEAPTAMLVNGNENHWTALVLVPSEVEGVAPKCLYADSVGGKMPSELHDFLTIKGVTIFNYEGERQQNNGFDCGPRALENAKELLRIAEADQSDEDLQANINDTLAKSARNTTGAEIRLRNVRENKGLFGSDEEVAALEAALVEGIDVEEKAKKKKQQDGEGPTDVSTTNVTIGLVNTKGSEKSNIPKAVFNKNLESLLGGGYEDQVSRKPDGSIDSIGCRDAAEAEKVAKAMLKFCQDLGLECGMEGSKEGGGYLIGVKMPTEFKGRDPFSMNAEEIAGLKKITLPEKSVGVEGDKGLVGATPPSPSIGDGVGDDAPPKLGDDDREGVAKAVAYALQDPEITNGLSGVSGAENAGGEDLTAPTTPSQSQQDSPDKQLAL